MVLTSSPSTTPLGTKLEYTFNSLESVDRKLCQGHGNSKRALVVEVTRAVECDRSHRNAPRSLFALTAHSNPMAYNSMLASIDDSN